MLAIRVRAVFVAAAIALGAYEFVHGEMPQVDTGTWQSAGSLGSVRSGAASALLSDGTLLVTGGADSNGSLATVDLLGPDGTFSAVAPMNSARVDHTAVSLLDGRILVVGGRDQAGALQSTEVYSNGEWSAAGELSEPRWGHTATLLLDGRVLIAGGENGTGALSSVEIFDPFTGTFSFAGLLSSPRKGHAAACLADGRVLIAGGFSGDAVLNSIDIFDPATESVSALPAALTTNRAGLSATPLLDGRVLFFGGNDGTNDLASTEIFDPATGAITAGATAQTPRRDHQAFLLPNNNAVLMVGGVAAGVASASAELYLPWLNQFWATGSSLEPRYRATGSALSVESYGDPVIGAGLLAIAGGDARSTSDVYGFATITTDRSDYSPGMKVYVSGNGWQPLEQIVLTLREDPSVHSPRTFTLTADESGALDNAFLFDVDVHDLGLQFYLTARGVASQAQVAFTDAANTQTAISSSVNPSSPNQPVTFTATVTLSPNGPAVTVGTVRFVEGGNNNCTGNLTVLQTDVAVNASGQVTFTTSGLSAGNHAIRACYTGTHGNTGTGDSASPALTQTVNSCTAPTIVTQPVAQSIGYGSNTTFTAAANGSPTPGVQWQVTSGGGFENISGATNASLTLNKPRVSSSGTQYRAVFTNTCNGTQSATTSAATLTVAQRSVGGSFTAQNKLYDGNTAANVLSRSVNAADVISGDTVTLSGGTAVFDSKNVGTGKTVTLSGATLGGADAGNYALTSVATTTADITAKGITGSFTAQNKPYDGTTAASVAARSVNAADVISGDTIALTGGTAVFDTKNVGTGKTVTLSGATLGGADAGNYALTSVATTTADITAKGIIGSFTAQNKPYDGTTAATVLSRSVTTAELVSGDAVTLSGGTAAFDTKNVGTGKTVTLSGVTLGGADASNYALSTVATTTADITAKSISGSFTAQNKTYDGTIAADVLSRSVTTAELVSGDTVTLTGGQAAFDTKNVGTGKTVTLSGATLGGADAGNYALTSVATTTADITAKGISGSFTAQNKTYDGTIAADVLSRSVTTAELVSGDTVTLTGGSATFDTKNVGTGKTVTLSGATLDGSDAGNYALGTVVTTTADITAKSISGSFTAQNKIYDGTTAAAVLTRSVNAADVIGADAVCLDGGTATFDTKNVGTGKTMTLSGATLAGADAGNYALTSVATTTANVTPRTLVVTAAGVNKVYDGSTTATVVLSDNRVSGDVLTTSDTSASFDNKNVGTAKPIAVNGIEVTGTDAGNYTLNTTATATADISARSLVVSATGVNKVYDGTVTAQVTLADDRVGGDALITSHSSASFADKWVGTGKWVSVTGISVSGADAGNYSFNTTASTSAAITPLGVTGSFRAANKVYDGNASADVTSRAVNAAVSGDVVGLSGGLASFDNKNVGTGKPVTLVGAMLTGSDATNYTLDAVNGTTANITPRAVVVRVTADNKVYDGNAVASVHLFDDRQAGDALTTGYVGASFANKTVGTGKPVSVTGISVTGTDAGNYTFNSSASTTADITPKSVTGSFTAASKVFDGTTAATIVNRTLTGQIPGDNMALSGGTANFDTPLVGQNKLVTGTGFALSGTDAGNYLLVPATLTTSASITSWTVTGFYQPVSMGDWIYNTIKGGSTVPLKFNVYQGPEGTSERTDISAIKPFVVQTVGCLQNAVEDVVDFTTTGGTSLRYDPTARQFIQNWQTPKGGGACYRVTMEAQDGSRLYAYFKTK